MEPRMPEIPKAVKQKKFYFESMTDSGKTVSGYVFSATAEEARQKLNKNGMVVISLKSYSEEKTPEGINKYEFEATDKQGKIFRGEIEARDDYEAYKKLVLDYEFTVIFLVDVREGVEEKQKKKKQGVNPNWAIKLKEETEGEKKEKKEIISPTETEAEKQKLDGILEKKQEKMEFLQTQIDEIVEKVEILIQKYDHVLKPDKKRYIRDMIDQMSRLKHSNSVNHLKTLMLNLFELLSSDEIFVELQGELVEDMESIEGEFKTFSLGFKNKINKGLASISIDTEKIKEGIQNLHIRTLIQEVCEVVLFFFLGMISSGLLFLVVNAVQGNLGRVQFFLSSSVYWLFMMIAGILGGIFYWEKRNIKKTTLQENFGMIFVFLIVLGLLIVEFPVLFFWTRF